MEQIVFGGDLNGALSVALENRRDVAAMLASQPLSALIDDIKEALKTAASAADDDMVIVDSPGGCWWRSPPPLAPGRAGVDGGRAPWRPAAAGASQAESILGLVAEPHPFHGRCPAISIS